jgi:O-methyltransferase
MEDIYDPILKPEKSDKEFLKIALAGDGMTLVSPDRIYVLYCILKQCMNLSGEFWECGVYKGGTAFVMAEMLKKKANPNKLVLFDTFEGMPETLPEIDNHKKGDFNDTDVEAVRSRLKFSFVEIAKGLIPDTFKGRENAQICFAHIDTDLYLSVLDCAAFIYPRLSVGGIMIFDDYGFPSTRGAKKAVDEYFKDKPVVPVILPTGQALVFKGV